MHPKSFVATLHDENVIVVQATEELPELIHAAFYTPDFEYFLDGSVIWSSESEALAMQLVDVLTLQSTSVNS